ncbi:MAG: hypothetical protein ACPGWS_07805 [Solirubrobacterales bacterium]
MDKSRWPKLSIDEDKAVIRVRFSDDQDAMAFFGWMHASGADRIMPEILAIKDAVDAMRDAMRTPDAIADAMRELGQIGTQPGGSANT